MENKPDSRTDLVPSAPVLTDPTEFTVNITWQEVEGAESYILYRRQIPNEWSEAKQEILSKDKFEKEVKGKVWLINDLEPTSTYQFRLVAVFPGNVLSKESHVATIDTLVTSCVPNEGNGSLWPSCCTIV